jgi:hypothetical protein
MQQRQNTGENLYSYMLLLEKNKNEISLPKGIKSMNRSGMVAYAYIILATREAEIRRITV